MTQPVAPMGKNRIGMKKTKAEENTLHKMMRHRAVLRRAVKKAYRMLASSPVNGEKKDVLMLLDAVMKETEL